MHNVLHATLDNLKDVNCRNDVTDMFRHRISISNVLKVDYPYVWEAMSDIFLIPDVTSAIIRDISSQIHTDDDIIVNGVTQSDKDGAVSENDDPSDIDDDPYETHHPATVDIMRSIETSTNAAIVLSLVLHTVAAAVTIVVASWSCRCGM